MILIRCATCHVRYSVRGPVELPWMCSTCRENLQAANDPRRPVLVVEACACATGCDDPRCDDGFRRVWVDRRFSFADDSQRPCAESDESFDRRVYENG